MDKGKPRKARKSGGGKSRDANGKQHTVLLEKEIPYAKAERKS
jgi:hypothetical protein